MLPQKSALKSVAIWCLQLLIHRDIKSSNLLLDRHWRCKLADFGMVRELSSQRMTICGTDEYMSPELMLDEVRQAPACRVFLESPLGLRW